jgi:hypothetical protein
MTSLSEWFASIKDAKPFLDLPKLSFSTSDEHGAAGGENDPLEQSGNEPALVHLAWDFFHRGYSWLKSERIDAWRGGTIEACNKAHPKLVEVEDAFRDSGRLFVVDSNHGLDLTSYPLYYIFNLPNGQKFLFVHGHAYADFWNWDAWEIARAAVRYPSEWLHITGVNKTSPHPDNPERHQAVREAWKQLAFDNQDWVFLYGHLHEAFEREFMVPEISPNPHAPDMDRLVEEMKRRTLDNIKNTGAVCAQKGSFPCFEIVDGQFTLKEVKV